MWAFNCPYGTNATPPSNDCWDWYPSSSAAGSSTGAPTAAAGSYDATGASTAATTAQGWQCSMRPPNDDWNCWYDAYGTEKWNCPLNRGRPMPECWEKYDYDTGTPTG